MKNVPDLTICTVSYESRPLLRANLALTRSLNPGTAFRWLVAENTQAGHEDRLGREEEGFEVHPGAKSVADSQVAPASYHHGMAMDSLIPSIQTRFALFLDPDCYLVRPHWIDQVIEHMQQNQLSFFGVPWHPKWFVKYRYFPCVHCMFVDLQKVSVAELSFLPQYSSSYQELPASTPKEVPAKKRQPGNTQRGKSRPQARPGTTSRVYRALSGRVLKPFRSALRQVFAATRLPPRARRQLINSSPDTGFRIHHRFLNDAAHRHECVTACFRIQEDLRNVPHVTSLLNRLVEACLPERQCFIPKRAGYTSSQGFRELGFPDTRELGCEEFLWKREPFCFHVRCFPRRVQGRFENDSLRICNTVSQFSRKVA